MGCTGLQAKLIDSLMSVFDILVVCVCVCAINLLMLGDVEEMMASACEVRWRFMCST